MLSSGFTMDFTCYLQRDGSLSEISAETHIWNNYDSGGNYYSPSASYIGLRGGSSTSSIVSKTYGYPVRCQRIVATGGGDSEGTGENYW